MRTLTIENSIIALDKVLLVEMDDVDYEVTITLIGDIEVHFQSDTHDEGLQLVLKIQNSLESQ